MKVAVVGGGVMGLAAARELARRGHAVDVHEQFGLGNTRGSSHGTSRIFRLSYDEEEWIRLAQRAYELWRELEAETQTNLLELNGLVDVESDPAKRLAAFDRCGVEYEVISPDELRARFGFDYADAERIVLTRDAGISLADAAVRAFAESARAHGATIHERSRVDRLEDMDADVVVAAAGGWAPKLLADWGIALHAEPTRETVAYFARRDGGLFPSVIDWLTHRRLQLFALSAPGVGVKAGLHHGGSPTEPDREEGPDAEIVDAIASWVRERFPQVDPTPVRAETCIYTTTPDERFVIERHGRIVVCSACSGHGFKFAPAVGELVADLVVPGMYLAPGSRSN